MECERCYWLSICFIGAIICRLSYVKSLRYFPFKYDVKNVHKTNIRTVTNFEIKLEKLFPATICIKLRKLGTLNSNSTEN